MALYNCNGLVAPRQTFVQYLWYHLINWFCVEVVFPAALLHTVHLAKGYNNNPQGLGKTQPRVEFQTY